MAELKPCPFCGGQAFLQMMSSHITSCPSVIRDRWKVDCENHCCWTTVFQDEIFHDETGLIVIAHDGSKEAIEAWNRRAGDSNG